MQGQRVTSGGGIGTWIAIDREYLILSDTEYTGEERYPKPNDLFKAQGLGYGIWRVGRAITDIHIARKIVRLKENV